MTEDSEMKRSGRDTNASNKDGSTSSSSKQQKVKNSNKKVIHDAVNAVRQRVKAFKKEHLGAMSNFDFPACSRCLEEKILPTWRIPAEVIFNSEEFLLLTLQKEVSEEVMGSNEYIDLVSISKRSQAFQNLVSDCKPRLLKCLKQNVHVWCTSLKEMSGRELSVSVSDYDEKVHQHHQKTKSKLKELNQSFQSYQQLVKPFVKFIKEGQQHTRWINQVCNNFLELCKQIENWVNDDDAYPDLLLEEFESNKKVMDNLRQSLLQTDASRVENMYEMQKLMKSELRAESNYIEYRKEKNQLKARKLELENKRQSLLERIDRLRHDQDKVKKFQHENSIRSIREVNYSQEKLDMLQADIEKLGGEKKNTDRKLEKIHSELKPVVEKTYEHKVEAVTIRHQREELLRENNKLEREMKAIDDRISNINASNEVLMKIRELKLSPGLFQKYTRDKKKHEASISSGEQALTDACRFAAPYIGKDWQKVYLSLPFDPPREVHKRRHDVNIMDFIAARNDIPWNDQAFRSLEKWRAYHRHGNVRELIYTLRNVKKKHLADRLQQKFIAAAT